MAPIAIDTPSTNGTSSRAHRAAPTPEGLYAPLKPQVVDPTAARRPAEAVTVDSPNLSYSDDAMIAKYIFHATEVVKDGDRYRVKPVEKSFEFKTERKVSKTGLVPVYIVYIVASLRFRQPDHALLLSKAHASRMGR